MELSHVQRVRMLYKTILKLHRGMPQELQSLGNIYLRDEFKRHKTSNVSEVAVFMTEWTRYAVTLAEQLGIHGLKSQQKLGARMEPKLLESMRDDQVQQLYDLMVAATRAPQQEENKAP